MNKKERDERTLAQIRQIIEKRPTYGYRRVTAFLSRQNGATTNHKRVYRLMKENNLLLQRYAPKPTYRHDGKIITLHSNTRWCSDAMRIQCWNGEHVEIAFSLDCCDREVLAWVSSTKGISGQLVRDLMALSIENRFGSVNILPKCIQWLTDNGPGYVANETVLFGRNVGFEVVTTPARSPESNGMAEAFVKTFKRDYAFNADLSSARRVMEQLDCWFEDYNENHPHKGLGMRSPREFRRSLTAN